MHCHNYTLHAESSKATCLLLTTNDRDWKCNCLTVQHVHAPSCTVSPSFEKVRLPFPLHLLVTNAVVAQEAVAPVAALHWTD